MFTPRPGTAAQPARVIPGVLTETEPATAVYRHRVLQTAGVAGLVAHLLLAGWLVLRPLPVAWVYDANLTPLASLRSSSGWQVAGELLVLAPLGVLLPLAGGRIRAAWFPSFLRTTGVASLLATGLEFLSSWTPGHVLNVDHILFAVIGAAVTHLAVVPIGRTLLTRERRERPQVPQVTVRPAPARVYAETTAAGVPQSR